MWLPIYHTSIKGCFIPYFIKVYDDATIAASLLHEVFKHCDIKRDSDDLVSKYGLDPEVLELIRLVSKPDNLSNEEYYSKLKLNCKALLIKLSNRANTCTRLSVLNQDERSEYILENREYIYPLLYLWKSILS